MSSRKETRVFEFNDERGEFQELERNEEIPLHSLLDSDSISLFIDRGYKRVWIWIGVNTTTRMKFHAIYSAPSIRDRYAFAFKIISVDEGEESLAFKVMVGLKIEEKYEEEQTEPQYKGTPYEEELFESITNEKILLILEENSVPEGYERRLVIYNGNIYYYKEYERNYLGSNVTEKSLFHLKEKVDDGTYLMENYTPRLIISFSKIVLIEFLHKTDDNN